ncbi:MAG: SpoIID/LytB domain-containing protein, partial [Clostridia bacterium]|nr:SpoIID/LytB domain-containing protein [Clostridia bacterium]
MKKMFVILIIISSIMLLLPLSVMGKNEETKSVEMSNTSLKVEKEQKDTFNVLDKQSGKVVKMDVGEYIFSVVAAEMPALYEKEAIKAQAVAAYTFALIRKNENSDKEYDITTDFTVDQSFISREDARKKWGDKADEYENKIEGAIEDVKGYKVTYNGELALTVYHALSCGKTESSENVWGKAFPYLEPVLSEWD